jgi:endonuclease/exonuclease/phosphatase (EEP) superfamily protein YafD
VGACLIGVPWLWFAVRGLGSNMDAVAIALPVAGVIVLLLLTAVAGLRRRWLPLLVGASVFLATVVATVQPRIPQSGGAPRVPITLAMANVYEGNPTPAAAASTLAARRVDLLAAVETAPAFWRSLRTDGRFPYRVIEGQLGVESLWPVRLLAPHGLPRSRLLRIGVDAPGAPFVLYVAHAFNPLHDFSTFADQRTFADRVVSVAETEQRPVVIVGDLNTSDRSQGYRTFTSVMRDAMRANASPASTYDGGWWSALFLRIDHAFVPSDWCATDGSTFSVPGSDHHGLQVTVGPCP